MFINEHIILGELGDTPNANQFIHAIQPIVAWTSTKKQQPAVDSASLGWLVATEFRGSIHCYPLMANMIDDVPYVQMDDNI